MILTVAHIVALLIVSFLMGKRADLTMHKFFWPALLLKIICGLALGLLYIHYYAGGDTISYFEDASNIGALLREDVGEYFRFLLKGDNTFALWSKLHYPEPRALFLSKIASVFTWATGNNYWVTSIYFSVISFLGTWYATRFMAMQYPKFKNQLVFAFLFFPSVVFWTSGLVKESFSMAALCFLVVLFLKVYQRVKLSWWEWVLLPVALWLLWNLKYYYVAVLVPVAFTAIVMKRSIFPLVKSKSAAVYVGIWLVIFAVPLFAVSRVHPNFYPEYFLEVIASSYRQFAEKSDPGDMVVFNELHATPSSIVTHAPRAFFTGLFRPFLWEVQNKLQFIAAIENMIILLLSVFALANLKRLVLSPARLLLFSILVYVALLCVFLTLSTPNYGTLVRYRVGFLPFFILLITMENRLFNTSITFLETIFSGVVGKRT
jgi:hypothetical protein